MKWLNGEKIRLVLIGFVAGIVLGGGNTKADSIWTRKADMTTPRWGHTSAVVDGKIYVIGGETSEPDSSLLSTVEEYDPTTNTWTRKADMPTARGWITPSSPVVDGKIYVIGGWRNYSISTVEEYDPATDTWIRKANMPTPRDSLASVALDGKIYAIGGIRNNVVGLKTVEVYDPATDTWTRKADMPLGMALLIARVVNGKIYAIRGRPYTQDEPDVQEYDPATDTWTLKADMPVATSEMASVVFDNKITVIGGWRDGAGYPYTTVRVYDPETDILMRGPDVPFRRAAFTAEVVNNRIYVIGGTDGSSLCPALSTNYEFGPLVDFDWDGIVDIDDLALLIENWGTNESLCDIAPLPFGDGIVDKMDLDDFMSYWGQEILPVELVAFFRLDETEGDIANDSVGGNDGALYGEPTWQPDGGMIDGALEFDGSDDYIGIPLVFGSNAVPLSVFAWVKGGAPGQVIFSQANRSDWLCADAANGSLMTELRFLTKPDQPLISEVNITDGQWHRVGLVWDGANRILYVDDVEVASDTYGAGMLLGDLQIGAGNKLEEGTFWSGLIDDVRIYNRAVTP